MTGNSERSNSNMTPSLIVKSNAADNADVVIWGDPSTHRLLVDATVSISSTTDNSAFIAGTTGGSVSMGFYHSTIDTVTDGRAAALAIDSKRNLFVVVRDAAGNARGLNIDASGNMGAVLQTQTDTVMIGGVNLKEINAVTPLMGNGVTGTGSLRVTIASDNTAFGVTATLQTQTDTVMIGGVNIKEINAVTPLMGNGVTGTGSQRVTIASDNTAFNIIAAGDVAHASADSGKPVKVGARAINAEITALSNNNRSDLITDLVGKLIVLPYANPENFVSGAITSAMTGTTSTSLIAAPASGLRNYITQITVSNSHATVGTDVIIQDGSGGTTLYTIPAAAVYGGASVSFPVPLKQPTTATAIFCANVTTGASTKVSASGYKGV